MQTYVIGFDTETTTDNIETIEATDKTEAITKIFGRIKNQITDILFIIRL